MLQYIKNEQHYSSLIEAIRQAKRTVWIGTADIKDLYIKEGKDAVPLLKLLEQKVKEGVEVRLIQQKNRDRTSAMILISILCFGVGWSAYFVRVSISSY